MLTNSFKVIRRRKLVDNLAFPAADYTEALVHIEPLIAIVRRHAATLPRSGSEAILTELISIRAHFSTMEEVALMREARARGTSQPLPPVQQARGNGPDVLQNSDHV